ncbi:hypothetical protein [Mesorhizobium sp. IMUNJ 23232]|uniref:hypothetical protein n=1 Tax=Mesorhizobium sp. IMUNJ 23232 TaxID=3376064 RepID=UPI0037AF0CEF
MRFARNNCRTKLGLLRSHGFREERRMLVSNQIVGEIAKLSIDRAGDEIVARLIYQLPYKEDENGNPTWVSELAFWSGDASINNGFEDPILDQTLNFPYDAGMTARLSYVVIDNIGSEFAWTCDVTAFDTAANFVGSNWLDIVFGSAEADTFRSVGSRDMIEGGAGNDLYRIYSADTKVFESASGGTDRIASGVSYTLAAGVAVEQLTTNGSTGASNIRLTGNEFAQSIFGNAGANILDGKSGNDTLTGLSGKDSFVFSTALGATNVDKITDFDVADDTIRLENAIFTALTSTGVLPADLFKDNILAPRDADDRIIYNSNTGSLFYDADGLGGMAAVKVASLAPGLALTAADFVVI